MIDGMKYNAVMHKKQVISEFRNHIAASLMDDQLLEEADEMIACYDAELKAIKENDHIPGHDYHPDITGLLDMSHDNLTCFQKLGMQDYFTTDHPYNVMQSVSERISDLHDKLIAIKDPDGWGTPPENDEERELYRQLVELTLVYNSMRRL